MPRAVTRRRVAPVRRRVFHERQVPMKLKGVPRNTTSLLRAAMQASALADLPVAHWSDIVGLALKGDYDAMLLKMQEQFEALDE